VASFLNYTNSYRDESNVSPIASWTTVDVTLKYLFDADSGPLANLSLLTAANNITDRRPPFVLNPVGINFDGANANALGRMISIQLSKRW
jgi:outer membrane receptor protein involved in Fe transport